MPGIGSLRAERIAAGWAEQKAVRDIMVFLHGTGVSVTAVTSWVSGVSIPSWVWMTTIEPPTRACRKQEVPWPCQWKQ